MTTLPQDPWHYPRKELAERYLDSFAIGLQSARGIFAKRRMGKTEFLTKDLIPAAQSRGYLTAYSNLWDNKENPAQPLIESIALAIEPKGLSSILNRFNPEIKNLKVSGKMAGLAEGAVEAELVEKGIAGTALFELLNLFDKRRKTLLLCMDEAQVLSSANNSNFAHALRAALDIRKDSIKVVFAGSSESTLRRMFARSSEPFYNWAPLEPFSLLGNEFVEDMVAKANALTKFPLSLQDALTAFAELNNTPEFFRGFINHYLTHAQQGVQAAIEATKSTVFNNAEFGNRWETLSPTDKEVLRMLAEGISDIHGKASRMRLGKSLGLEGAVSMNTPQQALKRLERDSIVTRIGHGEYRFEDEAFAQWIQLLDA